MSHTIGRVTLAEAAEYHGINYHTAWRRIKKYGWSIDSAFIPPKKPATNFKEHKNA